MQSLRKGSIMRDLDKQLFYSKLHSALIKKYGDSGKEIWKDAADEYDKIISDKAIQIAVHNMTVNKRNTMLDARLKAII